MSPAIVGALACQRNSFLKTFTTNVISCQPYETPKAGKGKKLNPISSDSEKTWAVQFDDTILFPEGGGQPNDTGTITTDNSTVNVTNVLRDKLAAVHILLEPLAPGSSVKMDLHWPRRLDIMQQHTGQHLLSAVFDSYNLETLSWSMGSMINYIELPKKVNDELINEVSEKINALIVENHPISVVTPDDHGREVDVSHLPDDYDQSQGIIRIVKIGDLDANPCCGTHLTSTGQIQAITLLHQANIRGGNSRLHFVCGSRVSKLLAADRKMLKDILGNQLSCQIEELGTKVGELYQNYKKCQSREMNLIKELSSMKAFEIFQKVKKNDAKLAFVYREDSSPEYFTSFQKELSTLINNDESKVTLDAFTVILVNGDYKSGVGGMVKVMGPRAEEIQAQLKKIFSNLKGGGRGSTFQGKISKYEKGELEEAFRYFELLEV